MYGRDRDKKVCLAIRSVVCSSFSTNEFKLVCTRSGKIWPVQKVLTRFRWLLNVHMKNQTGQVTGSLVCQSGPILITMVSSYAKGKVTS